MKKIIILLRALLMSACLAVKPAETLSSIQTESVVSETTVAEIVAQKKTTEPIQKETEAAIEASKEELNAPFVSERPVQKPAPEITAVIALEQHVRGAGDGQK